jgi:hypothetical protein
LSHSEQSSKIFSGRLILCQLPQSSSKRLLHGLTPNQGDG